MTPRINNRKRKRKTSRKPQDSITKQQYEHGWSLVSTWHTTQQVITGTGLTRPQLIWLTRIGSTRRKMPSYNERMTEQIAAIRKRSMDAAERVGKDAVIALTSAGQITHRAQDIAKSLLGAYMMRLQGGIQAAQVAGTITEIELNNLGMPKAIRETLKVLKPYTDFSEVARSFATVFDSPHQDRNILTKLPKSIADGIDGDASMPAALALVEDIGDNDISHDVLDDLLPEFKGWTDEDIEHFLATGERPAKDFGNQPIPFPAPDVIDVPKET